jgi:hypothetical protein
LLLAQRAIMLLVLMDRRLRMVQVVLLRQLCRGMVMLLMLRRRLVVMLLLLRRRLVLLLSRRRRVGCSINRHEILADKDAAEQAGQRPALGGGAERHVGLEQVHLLAALEANAAQQNETQRRAGAGAQPHLKWLLRKSTKSSLGRTLAVSCR